MVPSKGGIEIKMSEEVMKFKERYLAGEIEFDEIHRFASRWNQSDDPRRLAEYLGLNEEEEDIWIDESDEALKEILDKQRE